MMAAASPPTPWRRSVPWGDASGAASRSAADLPAADRARRLRPTSCMVTLANEWLHACAGIAWFRGVSAPNVPTSIAGPKPVG